MTTANYEGGQSSSRPFTIAVEGNIGAGKSTFLEHYSKVKPIEILPEPVYKWRNMQGKNLLELSYQDPDRWSHLVQSYIQLTMAENHVQKLSPGKQIKMLERSIHSSRHCFIQNFYDTGKMSEAGYQVLVEWFDFLTNKNNQMDVGVDMFIYLRTSPQVAYQRVRQRARKEEEVVALEYLTQIHNLHEKWMESLANEGNIPVLVVDADKDVKEVPDIYTQYEDSILSKLNAAKSPRKPLMNLSTNQISHNRVIGSA